MKFIFWNRLLQWFVPTELRLLKVLNIWINHNNILCNHSLSPCSGVHGVRVLAEPRPLSCRSNHHNLCNHSLSPCDDDRVGRDQPWRHRQELKRGQPGASCCQKRLQNWTTTMMMMMTIYMREVYNVLCLSLCLSRNLSDFTIRLFI